MYPIYACYEGYVVHVNKTKSHKFIYECILFFVLKKSDLLLWVKKKNDFGLEKKNQICFCCVKKDVFFKRKFISIFLMRKFSLVETQKN